MGHVELVISSKSRWVRLKSSLPVEVQIPGPPSKTPLIILGLLLAITVVIVGRKIYMLRRNRKNDESDLARRDQEEES